MANRDAPPIFLKEEPKSPLFDSSFVASDDLGMLPMEEELSSFPLFMSLDTPPLSSPVAPPFDGSFDMAQQASPPSSGAESLDVFRMHKKKIDLDTVDEKLKKRFEFERFSFHSL